MSVIPNRSRHNARKRVHDDASYISTNPNHLKRQSGMDNDPTIRPAKRKRLVTSDVGLQERGGISLIDFPSLPSPFIHHYLNHFDLVPIIRPIPTTAEPPPPPYTFLNPHQYIHPPPPPPSRPDSPSSSATLANRPRRTVLSRSTSTPTAQIPIPIPTRTPILADVAELHAVLATLAGRHFRSMFTGAGDAMGISGREEVDTLAAFMCAVENGQRGPGIPRRR
ncbi:hypothetical protein E1B28_001876 [Marasmius oreades]|uniref:Uncharacterized protein n=1 Tax=Marasmius oreades TaxID=181124 RepID=A0A9P7V4G8_9AGAR|nr:uncharacterized protein E1B28_001876 [Marasmius oreades]KAG7100096.1 hypothetical protein E1B28_001876 [Marasmius oreades]